MAGNQPFCVTFAGPVGSSKTPIANYLSFNFNLPVFNNDSIRSEVSEDLLDFNQDEYLKRRDERLNKIIGNKKSIIYDASIDRGWDEKLEIIKNLNFQTFIISIDISREFLLKLYKAKSYKTDPKWIGKLMAEHKAFLEKHNDIVNVHITDENFKDRLEICRKELEKWLIQ